MTERIYPQSPNGGQDILAQPWVVFADDFGRHPSSAQHLMANLPRRQPLVWVNTIGLRRPSFSVSDARRAFGVVRRWVAPTEDDQTQPPGDRQGPVHVISPAMSPGAPTGLSRRFNRWSLVRGIQAALPEGARPVVLTTLPLTSDLVGLLNESLHVYYCVDDYTQWAGGYQTALRQLEDELLTRVDGVAATSRHLLNTRVPRSGRSLYLPHGVDLDRFGAEVPAHPTLAAVPSPRVGYLGLLDERHDLELWQRVVSEMPDVHFVLVGPRAIEPSFLHKAHNVTLIDAVPYEEVPSVLAGFDVAILPYRIDGAGRSINPLKGKEILAAGVPLVATPLPEFEGWPETVLLASTASEMVPAVRQALAISRSSARATAEQFLRGESWSDKAALLASTLQNWCTEKADV